MLCLVTNEREHKRKEVNNRKEIRKKRKQIRSPLCLEIRREGEKKREEFLYLVCNKKGNEIKNMFLFLLLCPYKCERCIKIMDKYAISYHIILFMWILVF